ncbi:MAG: HAD-IA family hydrolase [Candidatus Uhrbacteria bacterium]
MKKIGAIGFDWVGVIFKYPGGGFCSLAAEFLGVDDELFQQVYSRYNHLVNKGIQGYGEAVEMWQAILAELGKLDDLDRFVEFIKSRPAGVADPKMLELLKRLRSAGWKLGLLSNHSLEGAQEFRDRGFDKFFEAIIFSSEVGYMKPEPEAFLKLAATLNIPVSELVFIDDSERCLSTAEQVGYTPIRFKSVEDLVDQLRKLGINF